MATITGKTTSNYWTHRLVVTEGTPSTENNTSPVTVEVYVGRDSSSGSYMYGARMSGTVTISGVGSKSFSYNNSGQVNISAGGWLKVATVSFTVPHNDDGSKTITVSDSFTNNIHPKSGTASGTVKLTTIARASQPSCITWPEHTQNVGQFGDEIAIHMNRKADTFTHTVRYAFGEQTGTIATGVTTGTTWVIPLSLMNLIPDALSGSGLIYVDTYNGSTLIGTKYCGFTATVPASVKPSVAVSLDDVSGVDETYGSPVRGLSRIKIKSTPTLAYSSPIASYRVTCDGVTYTEAEVTTGILQTAGSSPVTVTVTDKRGRSGSFTYTMNVQDYNLPVITALSVHRCDEDGTENDKGDYVEVTFSADVTSLGSKNTAAYALLYKQTSADSYNTQTLTSLANKYDVNNATVIFAANGNSSYDVQIKVTDRHSTATRSTSVSTAATIMNFKDNGLGLGLFKVSEKDNTVENAVALRQMGHTYAFQPEAFNGAKGYTLLAVITLTTLNVNAPIVFVINRRGALCPMTVYARFASSSDSLDPDLASFTYTGDNFGAFMVKSSTSSWKLYVDNTTGWSNPCLQSWYTTDNQSARMSVEFPNEQVEGTTPSVLGTYYRAVPAELPSLRDYIFPVGSIYLAYNHTSPAALFGGTWLRIENAFLWATTSGGTIGQTGGSSTHTLTVNEIPSHRHSSKSMAAADESGGYNVMRSDTFSALVDTVSYTAYSGGGAAHNNMPPYIQISAWRRTE